MYITHERKLYIVLEIYTRHETELKKLTLHLRICSQSWQFLLTTGSHVRARLATNIKLTDLKIQADVF